MPNFFRSLMPTLFGFLGGLLAACAVGATRADSPPIEESARVHDVIRARKFELVDRTGRVLGVFKCNADGDTWQAELRLGTFDERNPDANEGIGLCCQYNPMPGFHPQGGGVWAQIDIASGTRGQFFGVDTDGLAFHDLKPGQDFHERKSRDIGISQEGGFWIQEALKTRVKLHAPTNSSTEMLLTSDKSAVNEATLTVPSSENAPLGLLVRDAQRDVIVRFPDNKLLPGRE